MAAKLFRKASDLGDAQATYDVGTMYDNARGVARDYEEAMRWYTASAEAGYAPAMARVGHMYEVAAGVPKDYAKAFSWYKRAADAGNAQGMLYLGSLYESGHAVPTPGSAEVQDSVQAFAWFEKSANADNVQAMYRLVLAYSTGTGVKADMAGATDWAQKASWKGSQEATAWLKAHGVAVVPDTPAAVSPQTPTPPGVFRAGGDLSVPRVIYKEDPQYPERPRQLGIDGRVVLSVTVAPDGHPRDVTVIRPLGYGLDEKAVEAVQKWRFRPAVKDGQPVSVRAQVEVNFRLVTK